MNKEKLMRVADHIVSIEPDRFTMSEWCGYAACIAGWTVALEVRRNPPEIPASYNFFDEGIRHLGLDREEGMKLFLMNRWPENFNQSYYQCAGQDQARAQIARQRIIHFINTGE